MTRPAPKPKGPPPSEVATVPPNRLGRVIEFDRCSIIRSMSRRYALTDRQWSQIKDLLPGRAGHVGAPAKNNRLFVDAVLYRYRAGIAWRDLPERFGDFRVVHLRHMRWSRRGVWQRLFEALAAGCGQRIRHDRLDHRARAPAQQRRQRGGSAQAIGRSRGGLSTKIHATVDALGNPTGFMLMPGAGLGSERRGCPAAQYRCTHGHRRQGV